MAWRRQQYADRDRGTPVILAKARTTVAQEAQGWLDALRPFASNSTYRIRDYQVRALILPTLGARWCPDLTKADVEAWAAAMGRTYSVTNVNQSLGTLARILDGAIDGGRLATNPGAGHGSCPRRRRKQSTLRIVTTWTPSSAPCRHGRASAAS